MVGGDGWWVVMVGGDGWWVVTKTRTRTGTRTRSLAPPLSRVGGVETMLVVHGGKRSSAGFSFSPVIGWQPSCAEKTAPSSSTVSLMGV